MTAPLTAMDSRGHLALQLERLDLLIHREILRLRARDQLAAGEMRGLYISDGQVDALVGRAGEGVEPVDVVELTRRAELLRCRPGAPTRAELPWLRLARQFELTLVEEDLLLIAVALEIDPKYETLFGYLNDHIARRWPTVGLALSLVAPTRAARLGLRPLLRADGRLFRSGLLRPVAAPGPPERASGLALGFQAAPAVVRYVLDEPLGAPEGGMLLDGSQPGGVDPLSASLRVQLERVGGALVARQRQPLVVLQGRAGSGRRTAARVVAAAARASLIEVDARTLTSRDAPPHLAADLTLQSRLAPTVLLVSHFDGLLDPEGRLVPEAGHAAGVLEAFAGPVCLAVEPATPWRELAITRHHVVIAIEIADEGERARQWRAGLRSAALEAPELAIERVADRFALTARQIRAATETLALQGATGAPLDEGALFAAARAECRHRLGELATTVESRQSWDDLVLPPATLQRLREIVGSVAHRHLVYESWDFGRGGARGLKVMFAGPSGTGKTMSAGVMARALGLDLYRIDLSGVVSKFIGETEKNLARIFRAAASSNAVLFFDEADALFGKRSEVKDAHDRHANIEVAYLLQRIEEYDGLVILATNLSRNVDQAFSRRLQHVVEFPMPDETQRERLWRANLGAAVPLAADVDPRFLAKHFPIAGGDIRNVALDAAFLAAQDGQVVTMEKLVRAMARQMTKQGRIPSAADFKHFHALLAGDGA